eukprot:CAMPEP_0206442772 /NCGR_PEP_ID=MMETSP0324_2-20121206/14004_1 /ASSEMBLY_ACC=CAM_ASM_000836 /TAXON_ID=2866 /ORGANISM="Crypthecodinium cohnii, Strain Seligo" /LENGTH=687 /DNA_ID=CAMNT_0053910645 /DNA_START=50 /DNA_END=2113 /DNA_ORIENTATION=-
MALPPKLLTVAASVMLTQVFAGADCSGQNALSERCLAAETEEEVALLAHRREVRKIQAASGSRAQTAAGLGTASQMKSFRGRTGRYSKYVVEGNMALVYANQPSPGDAPDAKETRMLEIIESTFKGIDQPGGFLAQNIRQEPDETWTKCSTIPWTTLTEKDLKWGTTIYSDMEHALGIEKYCNQGDYDTLDPTCLAIYAAFNATMQLIKEFPNDGPAYYNATVTAWGESPSWFKGAVSDVNYNEEPPTAKVLDPNGMTGYMICDMVRNIATQSPNQVGSGSCSHMAPLAAISREAPAQAIKLATKLMWTGRWSLNMPKPCDYVYTMQPGLVPYYSDNGGWEPSNVPESARRAAACTGNAADCEAGKDRPMNPVGMVWAYFQTIIGSYSRYAGGTCDRPPLTLVNWPGISKTDADYRQSSLGGTSVTALFGCQQTIDPKFGSCKNIFNIDVCEDSSDEACIQLLENDWEQREYREFLDWAEKQQANPSAIPELLTSRPKTDQEVWEAAVQAAGSKDPVAILTKVMPILQGKHYPSFSEDLLAKACNAKVAQLTVAADALSVVDAFASASDEPFYILPNEFEAFMAQEFPQIPQEDYTHPEKYGGGIAIWMKRLMGDKPNTCDHAVYLESCFEEEEKYTIWSWGTRFNVSKTMLLGNTYWPNTGGRSPGKTYTNGIICQATIADHVSWE